MPPPPPPPPPPPTGGGDGNDASPAKPARKKVVQKVVKKAGAKKATPKRAVGDGEGGDSDRSPSPPPPPGKSAAGAGEGGAAGKDGGVGGEANAGAPPPAPGKPPAKKSSTKKVAKKVVKKSGAKAAAKGKIAAGTQLWLIGEEWGEGERIGVRVREGRGMFDCIPPLAEALEVESLLGLRFHRMSKVDPEVPERRALDITKPPADLGLAPDDYVYVAKRADAVATLFVCARDMPFDEGRSFVVGLHEPVAAVIPDILAAIGKETLGDLTMVWGEGGPPAIKCTNNTVPRKKTPAQLGVGAGEEKLVYLAAPDEIESPAERAAKVALNVRAEPALSRRGHPWAEALIKDKKAFDLASRWRLESREQLPPAREIYFDDDDVPVPAPDEAVVDALLTQWAKFTPHRTSREEARRVAASYHGREDELQALLKKEAFGENEFRWLGRDPQLTRGFIAADEAMQRRVWETRSEATWAAARDDVRDVRTENKPAVDVVAVTAALALVAEMTRRLWWAPPAPNKYEIKKIRHKEPAVAQYRVGVARRRRLLREMLGDATMTTLDAPVRLMLSKMAYPPRDAGDADTASEPPSAIDDLHELQQVLAMLASIPSYYERLPPHLQAPLVEVVTNPLRERRAVCAAVSPEKKAARGVFASPSRYTLSPAKAGGRGTAADASPPASPHFVLEDADKIPLYLSPQRAGRGEVGAVASPAGPPNLGDPASYTGMGRLPDAYKILHSNAVKQQQQQPGGHAQGTRSDHATRALSFNDTVSPEGPWGGVGQLPPPPAPPASTRTQPRPATTPRAEQGTPLRMTMGGHLPRHLQQQRTQAQTQPPPTHTAGSVDAPAAAARAGAPQSPTNSVQRLCGKSPRRGRGASPTSPTSPTRTGAARDAKSLILFDHEGKMWNFEELPPEGYAVCSEGSPAPGEGGGQYRASVRRARSRSRTPGRHERRAARIRDRNMLSSPGWASTPEVLLDTLIPRGRDPCKDDRVSYDGYQRDAVAARLLGPGVSDDEKYLRCVLDTFYALHAPSERHRVPTLVATIRTNVTGEVTTSMRLHATLQEMCKKYRQPTVDWLQGRPPPALVRCTLRSFYTAYDPLSVEKVEPLTRQVCGAGDARAAVLDEILSALCTRFAHHGADARDWVGPYPACLQLLHHQ